MSKKIAIIGSGFGGLALAIRLQASGLETVILEKRDKPGGRAYFYEEKGFHFDAGPTVITAPHIFEELFELTDKKMEDYIELIPIDPFYRLLWPDGEVFNYNSDMNALYAQIEKLNPKDIRGYKKFLKFSNAVFKEGYEKMVDHPFQSIWSMVKVAPQLLLLQSFRSVYSMVSKYIKHPKLRQAFSYHTLLLGGNPYSSSAIYSLIHALEHKWGVWFAKGGTSALVAGLVKLYEDLGGTLHLNCAVQSIETNDNNEVVSIHNENGERLEIAAVASNADIYHTYNELLSNNKTAQKKTKVLKRKKFSPSLFLLHFGLRREHPKLAHHTILFGPRWKELLEDIYHNGVLPEDNALYLHAPSVTDKSMAPEGCSAYYALAVVPNLGKLNIDWSIEKERYKEVIYQQLEERCIPNLREDLVVEKIFTPIDFEKELNSYQGAAFSMEPLLIQSAYFRIHNSDQKIKGLYFAGAGTHPGAGVPGVVNSAKATARIMIDNLKNG